MDKTVDQIEARIDRKRGELGSNIQELERRVDAVTDWQQQFRSRPFVFLGVAAACGAFAAAALDRKHLGRDLASRPTGVVSVPQLPSGNPGFDVWNNVKTAALSLAGTRLKEYVDRLFPGFNEHYQRAEHRLLGSNEA
jgi:hypothetical protein